MLCVLQLRSMLLTYKVLIVSTCVLWFLKEDSCLSYVTTWLGKFFALFPCSCKSFVHISLLTLLKYPTERQIRLLCVLLSVLLASVVQISRLATTGM